VPRKHAGFRKAKRSFSHLRVLPCQATAYWAQSNTVSVDLWPNTSCLNLFPPRARRLTQIVTHGAFGSSCWTLPGCAPNHPQSGRLVCENRTPVLPPAPRSQTKWLSPFPNNCTFTLGAVGEHGPREWCQRLNQSLPSPFLPNYSGQPCASPVLDRPMGCIGSRGSATAPPPAPPAAGSTSGCIWRRRAPAPVADPAVKPVVGPDSQSSPTHLGRPPSLGRAPFSAVPNRIVSDLCEEGLLSHPAQPPTAAPAPATPAVDAVVAAVASAWGSLGGPPRVAVTDVVSAKNMAAKKKRHATVESSELRLSRTNSGTKTVNQL
jgi:hypothetical protein